MENKGDHITFEVDDTLYFDHGQEIAEMHTISMDPDIALEIHEAYVQIKGVLVLNGSYQKVGRTEYTDAAEVYPSKTYIEKIVDQAEGRADFYHRFPIDISIPKERINDVEDVHVQIDAFDYELPSDDTLNINATIHIRGLQENPEVEEVASHDNGPETIKAEDIKASAEETKAEIVTEEPEKDAEIVTKEERTHNVVDDTEIIESTEIDTTDKEQQAIDISLQESTDEEPEEKKDIHFLTTLFTEQAENRQSTLTIYISQTEDTIESIAKRFDIPTLKLVKDNQLSGEKLDTGQMLYISRE